MDYVNLGKTGLKVSRLCLGCMTYGVPERGAHPWTLPEAVGRPFIARALEVGINFFDTANVYSDGTSEEILGRALQDMARRDEVVIATKVHGQMRGDANGRGLSRKAIMAEIDAGSVPVATSERLVGMITDRDIAVRAVAMGKGPDASVGDVMTADVKYCFDDQEVEEVTQNMGDIQVRRLPVVNREKRLVGILSLGDVARTGSQDTGETLSEISKPGGKHSQKA
jgi:CBS domain-containing protein